MPVYADGSNESPSGEWFITEDPNGFTHPGQSTLHALPRFLMSTGALITFGSLAIPLLGSGVARVASESAAAEMKSIVYSGAIGGLLTLLCTMWVIMPSAQSAIAGAGAATVHRSGVAAENQKEVGSKGKS